MIYNLSPKFHVRHVGFSFYGLRKSDKGADTDLVYSFCWSKVGLGHSNAYRFMKHIL